MRGIGQDLRFAGRMLAKSPVFTIATLFCLALGIGANTAVFSVLYGVVLHSLPYADPGRLVALQPLEGAGEDPDVFSPADYLDLRESSRTMQDLAGHRTLNLNLTGRATPERVRSESVSPNFFNVFGVDPVLGRFFFPDGHPEAAGARNVVLSHGSWRNRFGGDLSVLGRVLILNGQPHTVVGVAPASFNYPENAELWVRSYRHGVPEPPIDLPDDLSTVRDFKYFSVVGRLSEGVTLRQARSEMSSLALRIAEAASDEDPESLEVVPLREALVGDVRPALTVLLGAAGLVLLIACANVANLLLARAAAREREVAVRAALGARRSRLLRQLLTENLILSLLGGGLGLLLAVWGVELLVRLAPSDVPRLSEIGVHAPVLFFALAISIMTGVVFGLLPALQASKPDLHETLKEGGRSRTEGRDRRRVSELLVVAEFALSLVLLCGTGLLLKSLVRIQQVDLGFRPENLLVMRLDLPDSRYSQREQREVFVRDVTERLSRLPGVSDAASVLALPFSGTAATLRYAVEGERADADEDLATEYQPITPGYFRTMGIPLLTGRPIEWRDDAEAPSVVVINETLARRHWPGASPIGRRISFGGYSAEIVGVVGDVRHFVYERPPRPEAYVPYLQSPWPFMALVVRAEVDAMSLSEAVRRELLAVDPDQPVYAVSTMERVLSDSIHQRRFILQLLGLFAAVALTLALVGISGVMSYSLNRRVHEMGIRMALGAQRVDVFRLSIKWGMTLVALGVVIGLVASLALTRLIAGLLYGTGTADPAVYLGVTIVLTAAAALAAYIPAYRASRLEPLTALRYE
ncbi:MAG: ABC transporter permease [Gemmatimonadota bacterium]|nr:MAG: ABC transporter permease [Gemmatimonadota bacterium]